MQAVCDCILSLAASPDATTQKQAFLLMHKLIANEKDPESGWIRPVLVDAAAQVALQVRLLL
jgi:hypothetical protein